MAYSSGRRKFSIFLFALMGLASGFHTSVGPAVTHVSSHRQITSAPFIRLSKSPTSSGRLAPLRASDLTGNTEEDEYTVATRLREEAESPFRNVRLFFYAGFAASGAIGGLTAFTGLLAGLNGVRGSVPVSESATNLAIDIGAVAIMSTLWNLEQKAKARRLDRMTMGAKLAGLKVQPQNGDDGGILSVSDFRRYRGQAKRVIVFAGKPNVVQEGLARALQFSDRLVSNDFIVIPVVLGKEKENAVSLAAAQDKLLDCANQPHIATPILMQSWQEYLGSEVEMASTQGVDAYEQGICVVLKLNGRVGQRTFGKPNWENFVGDVEDRRAKGMDVTNI